MADHAPSAVSLADAVAAGVPPTWTEAVSLVGEVARQLAARGPNPPVPTDAQILVLPTGVVQLAGSSEHPDGAVVAVGSLLGQYLDDVVRPQGLIEVQQDSIQIPPPFDTLPDLLRALEPWAQRDPKGELAGYYNRVARVLEEATAEQPLEAAEASAVRAESAVRQPSGRSARARRGRTSEPEVALAWRMPSARAVRVGIVVVVLAFGVVYHDALGAWLQGPVRRTATATVASIAAAGRRAKSAVFGAEVAPAPKPSVPPRDNRSPRERGKASQTSQRS